MNDETLELLKELSGFRETMALPETGVGDITLALARFSRRAERLLEQEYRERQERMVAATAE